MTTNQGLRQQSVRDVTGTAYDYNGDWMALFDRDGIAAGMFNERMLLWLNAQLGVTYTNINDAMAAYAELQGVSDWNSIGTISGLSGLLYFSRRFFGVEFFGKYYFGSLAGGILSPASIIDANGSIIIDANGSFVVDDPNLIVTVDEAPSFYFSKSDNSQYLVLLEDI